jgi:tetratricopeptide (TPR) repeat protein
MTNPAVSEEQIHAAVKLGNQGDFVGALSLLQDMLLETQDPSTRMLLLFHILSYSTQIDARDVTSDAMAELEGLPDSEVTRVLANSIKANAEIDLGRPQNALAILDLSLGTGLFERENFRVHKYRLFFLKGKALERLKRWHEALDWLEQAHPIFPDLDSCPDEDTRAILGWAETEILFNKARSMHGLDRSDEACELSKQAHDREHGDMRTLAMMYMASARVMQRNFLEALKLYVHVRHELPCRIIQVDQVEEGIARCVREMSNSTPESKPS